MLVKYVVVLPSGTWVDMSSNLAEMQAVAARTPGAHVERWAYPILSDDSHGEPLKVLRSSRSCSWCHEMNAISPGQASYCSSCSHRADLCRLDCDCEQCRQ